ncbi:hypothetical protein EQG49_06430 [Periweissella cryptocerci]|uniref:Uncharacterized protein n=1 Tax=Periweissella cryptocerci TaxID=2506420 RepID=A0A4P6YTM7_9LACO|nr:hypothetical protein [Periweissella cryptocerci]QBO36119.1 hypothetical protein EQG49_06430 [Periweissella cryptocerci]
MKRKISMSMSLALIVAIPLFVPNQASANQRVATEAISSQTSSTSDEAAPNVDANATSTSTVDSAVAADEVPTNQTTSDKQTADVVPVQPATATTKAETTTNATTIPETPAVATPVENEVVVPNNDKADLANTFSTDMLNTLAMSYANRQFKDLTDDKITGLKQYIADGNITINGATANRANHYFDLAGYQSLKNTTKNIVFANMITDEPLDFDGWADLRSIKLINVFVATDGNIINTVNDPQLRNIMIFNSGRIHGWHHSDTEPVANDDVQPVGQNQLTDENPVPQTPVLATNTKNEGPVVNSPVDNSVAGHGPAPVATLTKGETTTDVTKNAVPAPKVDITKRLAPTPTNKAKVPRVELNTAKVAKQTAVNPVATALKVTKHVATIKHLTKATQPVKSTGVKIANYWNNYHIPTTPSNEVGEVAAKITVVTTLLGSVEALWFFKKLR